jgi:hypothetical protein
VKNCVEKFWVIKFLNKMVDNGGSAPPNKIPLNESNVNSSSNVNSVPICGGKDDDKNVPVQPADSSPQISSSSPFGKGLGKKPIDFQKISEIYDKQNNVINLIPGIGLFVDLLKIFLIYFIYQR